MKRAMASLLLMLALIVPQAQAAGGRTATVWDGDRVIDTWVEVLEGDTLEITAGVNITFDAGEVGTGMPALSIAGGLKVCGTAERPVSFNSTPTLWALYGEPDCMLLRYGDAGGSVSVRNASFTDIVISAVNASGEFRDCRFDRCTVDIYFSAVRFINCTFEFSSLRNGRMAFARGGPQPEIRGCRFDADRSLSHPPAWRYGDDIDQDVQYFGEPAIEDWGGALVEDCTVTGYSTGIESEFNFATVIGCTVSGCMQGISLESDHPNDNAVVRDCTVTNCSWGVTVIGAVLMTNCTVTGGMYGVRLLSYGNERSGISGNRVYNNSLTGMVLYGKEAGLSDNFFGNGSSANGWGMLEKRDYILVRVTDPLGRPVRCQLSWTDALGNPGAEGKDGTWDLDLLEYSIDNSGERTDHFPYTLRAELAGRTNLTTLSSGTENITLVLPVLADLAAINLSVQPEMPVAGEIVAFSVRVENRGYYAGDGGFVSFVLDGREVDRRRIPYLKGGLTETVYSSDWNASPGRHTLQAVLDPDGNISEGDEGNNVIAFNFTVAPAPQASGMDRTTAWLQAVLIIAIMAVVITGATRRRRAKPEATSSAPTIR